MAAALRVSLDLESPTPAYRQIANDLRRHLVEERLKPGDLQLKRRRGATVIARNAPRAVDRREVDGLLRQLAQIAAQLRGAGMSSRQISSALRRIAQGARS